MADTQYTGWLGLGTHQTEANTHNFVAEQALGMVGTVRLVKVSAIRNGGGGAIAKPGIVDCIPLTNQTDGEGNQQQHSTVFGLQYVRYQCGSNAVIMDPQVGDIGIALVCDRDISANVANPGQQVSPNSYRRFNLSDGIYLGGILGPVPTQYLTFASTGVTLADANGNKVTLKSGTLSVDPGSGQVYLGGDGSTGSYSPVQTVAGPSINVKARFA